ncbi:MAG: nitrogenase [Desulfobulbaceae bacterium]|jgi:nitrogenase molybdenum-iron protein NifN|nr:nitrogenase [Desulfobulbaceae bacterium]
MSKMPPYAATENACKLCKPLGASLAFRGIEGTVPFLHGSQGCATYMRRYIISHFNEPIDIASSSLGEKHAVYGGAANLKQGLDNVIKKYQPRIIGVATTCLTETIGDDVPMILAEYKEEANSQLPELIHVSTPSYAGTHMEGFVAAAAAAAGQLTEQVDKHDGVNLFPGFVSAADLRHLREIMDDFAIDAAIFPDYSETLDGEALAEYPLIPKGGTPLHKIRAMGGAKLTIECGWTLPEKTAGTVLAEKFATPLARLGWPMGIRATDRFFAELATVSGREIPKKYRAARGRLVDSLVDCHKYLSGKKAIVYGEEDLVVGLVSLLVEIGIQPTLCASGGKSGRFAEAVAEVVADFAPMPQVYEDVDFYDIEQQAEELEINLLLGHSKGYSFARRKGLPLVRVGFPIHDRMGGQRILHLGYHGAQNLVDTITNTLIAKKQDDSPVGYSYM